MRTILNLRANPSTTRRVLLTAAQNGTAGAAACLNIAATDFKNSSPVVQDVIFSELIQLCYDLRCPVEAEIVWRAYVRSVNKGTALSSIFHPCGFELKLNEYAH